jgi:enamine deaminase RidA (YjgF/YER057c/UK114 family)
VAAEAAQALENVRGILERHGASLDDVVKCTVFLAEMRDWPVFNEVYRKAFGRHYPARSALGANGLAIGARLELECVAYVPTPRREP